MSKGFRIFSGLVGAALAVWIIGVTVTVLVNLDFTVDLMKKVGLQSDVEFWATQVAYTLACALLFIFSIAWMRPRKKVVNV